MIISIIICIIGSYSYYSELLLCSSKHFPCILSFNPYKAHWEVGDVIIQVRRRRQREATEPAQGPQQPEAAQGPQAGLHRDPGLRGRQRPRAAAPRGGPALGKLATGLLSEDHEDEWEGAARSCVGVRVPAVKSVGMVR